MSRALARLARACARHPWRTILVWAVVLFSLSSNAAKLDGELVDDFRLPSSDAQRAADRLEASFPARSGASATVVLGADEGALSSEAAAIGTTLADVGELDHVVSVSDPFAGGSVSPDGDTAFAEVRYDRDVAELGTEHFEALRAAVGELADRGVRAEVGGPLAAWEQATETSSEQLGLLVAMVVLLFAFGSVVAMVLPIGMALFALVVGETLIVVLAAATDVPTSASSLAAMIGLGVGIDYSLFIVTRFREAHRAGRGVVDAAARAAETAGSAVLFAGTSVIIAISGLLLSGIWAVGVLGMAAAIVVAVTVASALTLLPALLGLLGRWIDRVRLPLLGRPGRPAATGLSARWARSVTGRPVAAAVAGTVALLVLALPVAGMRLGQSDQGSQPPGTSQRQAYDMLTAGFGPGFNGPLLVVAEVPDVIAGRRLEDLRREVAATPGVAAVSEATFNPGGDVAVFNAMPTTAPQDAATADVVHRLRDVVVPGAVAGTDLEVLVGGTTAGFLDLDRQMGERLPVVIGAVVALAFLLLMVAFRSILVPLKAAVMNLLSVGAAYGVIVAVFQWGWAKDAVGLAETVPIVSWVPMFLFAVLFGLSMDYEVFLLSRIREDYVRTGDPHGSVTRGLAATARVITAAALIMIAVFVAFVAHPEPVTKMVGLGLAAAVLVDATVVRMLLVPSLMVLMGDANWWMPRWLDRILPRVHVDGPDDRSRPGPTASPESPAAAVPPPPGPAPELVPTPWH
jgi:RND superfamily putative drug exporter